MCEYENQKEITICFPDNATATGINYTTVQNSWVEKASKRLAGAKKQKAMLLWHLLLFNKNGYPKSFSPAYYAKYYGNKPEYWRLAENILEDEGFIKKDTNGDYTFYVDPFPDEKSELIEENAF